MPPQNSNQKGENEKIKIDLDDEYEVALNNASQEEIIDLAGLYTYFKFCVYHLFLFCLFRLLRNTFLSTYVLM